MRISDFYDHQGKVDGKNSWCKDCVKELSKQKHEPPKSTTLGFQLLNSMGIPAHPGSSIGKSFIDIVAWGCIPIEAKYSQEHDSGSYLFGFSQRQKKCIDELAHGFILLFAESNITRVFLIPGGEAWVKNHFKRHRAISFKTETNRRNAHTWQYIQQWENRFDLLEIARKKYSQRLLERSDIPITIINSPKQIRLGIGND